MVEVEKHERIGPRIRVERAAQGRRIKEGRWLFAWRIENLGSEPLKILAGRLPHGKFRGEEREFNPAPEVLPHRSVELEFSVQCGEPAGTEVENAFLILRVLCLEESWWLFIRLRVIFNEGAEPKTVTELVTTKQIGFSGV